MEVNQEDTLFDQSLNKWTLTFKDNEQEQKFWDKYRRQSKPNLAYKIGFMLCFIWIISFRISKILCVGKCPGVRTGTLIEELISLIIHGGSLIIECVIYYCGFMQKIGGFFLFTALPIGLAFASFSLNKVPLLGVSYFYW